LNIVEHSECGAAVKGMTVGAPLTPNPKAFCLHHSDAWQNRVLQDGPRVKKNIVKQCGNA
jgi:hypothetical protein